MTDSGPDRDRQENMEQLVGLARGQKGDTGKQGIPGPGMSPGARQAVIFLFALSLLLAGANLLWTAHTVHANQVAQQRAGQIVERKLCKTFGKAEALKPPAGNPATNPSRAYLQGQHEVWVEVVSELHCRRPVGRRG